MAARSNVPATIPALGGEASLNRYLSEIKKFPILAPEQEYMLAKRFEEHGDTDAAAQLVTSHLRLVAKIAMGYRGYGLPVSELISEGNIGLMQGVKKFEADRGFRLATYAMWWIRASIQEYILRSWSLVKMGTTAAQKKLFFNLRRMKSQMQALDEGDLKPDQVEAIATKLGVKGVSYLGSGLLLANYVAAVGAAVANAGWFNQPLMIGAHALFSVFLIVKTKALETEGFTKTAVQRYYQNIWYLFYSEYLILPFI